MLNALTFAITIIFVFLNILVVHVIDKTKKRNFFFFFFFFFFGLVFVCLFVCFPVQCSIFSRLKNGEPISHNGRAMVPVRFSSISVKSSKPVSQHHGDHTRRKYIKYIEVEVSVM